MKEIEQKKKKKKEQNKETTLRSDNVLVGIEPAVGAAGCLMALVGSTVIAIFWAFPQVLGKKRDVSFVLF